MWFIPAMALQFAMVAMGAALRGTGNFKPGMVVQTATVILNMVLAPFLIFGWGTGRAARRGGRRDLDVRLVAVAVGVVWLTNVLHQAERLPALHSGALDAAVLAVEADAEDRPAGRRRVRA